MIKRKVLLTAVLLAGTSLTFAAEHTVKLSTSGAGGQMMVMEPGFIKIEKGDIINFVPSDASHNAQSVSTPGKAKAFTTPMGKATKITFNEEGVYIYKCLPHLTLGMVGVIQVGKSVNLDEAKQAATTLNTSIAMNKTRMADYIAQVN